MPHRRQAITWINADPIHWRIYAALFFLWSLALINRNRPETLNAPMNDHLWQRLVISSRNMLFVLLKLYTNVRFFIFATFHYLWLTILSKLTKSEHVVERWLTFHGIAANRTPQIARKQSSSTRVFLTALFINIAQLYFEGHDLLRHHCGWFY